MSAIPLPSPSPDMRKHLSAVHSALLDVHKALIDHEQVRYERENGPIGGPNEVLQVVLRNPWFAWLRPLTSLIVEIDEFLSSKPPQPPEQGAALLGQCQSLLVSREDDDVFHQCYFRSLQESPNVALAHGEWKLLLVQLGRG